MRKFLQIGVALLLALGLAAPACCCVFSEKAAAAEVSSCCGGSDLPDDHDCGCVKMEATAEWKAQETIPCNQLQLPAFAGYETPCSNLSPVLVKTETARDFPVDILPSLRRHALLQRFLI